MNADKRQVREMSTNGIFGCVRYVLLHSNVGGSGRHMCVVVFCVQTPDWSLVAALFHCAEMAKKMRPKAEVSYIFTSTILYIWHGQEDQMA